MTEDKQEAPGTTRGPLVFVSHDSRDAEFAEAFSKLLSSVSAGMLKSFRSSDRSGKQGFEYGVEWFPTLMGTLDTACDVVCLLTPRSLGRPWILYEAGVAKGKLDIPVHGLALGVPLAQASTGPFAQFQNCGDDVDSVTKLVMQLVRRLPNADPEEATLRTFVETFIQTTTRLLAALPGGDTDEAEVESSPAKLFEEIKVMFQDLPGRVERSIDPEGRRMRSRRRRLHPGMIEDLIMSAERPSPGLVAMIITSSAKDEFPWLFEMASVAYRAGLSGDSRSEIRALDSVVREARELSRGPFRHSSEEMMMLVEQLPFALDLLLSLHEPGAHQPETRREDHSPSRARTAKPKSDS